jgi:hypothetical protein
MAASVSTSIRRVATTTGTDATGQYDWVLKPNYQYFLSTCGGSCSGGITNNPADPGFTRILIADSNGLFSSLERNLAGGGVEFWTGLNAN